MSDAIENSKTPHLYDMPRCILEEIFCYFRKDYRFHPHRINIEYNKFIDRYNIMRTCKLFLNISRISFYKHRSLLYACKKGNIETLRFILSCSYVGSMEILTSNFRRNSTVLHVAVNEACKFGSLDILTFFIDYIRGVMTHINVRNDYIKIFKSMLNHNNNESLRSACFHGHVEIVKELMKYSKPNCLDNNGIFHEVDPSATSRDWKQSGKKQLPLLLAITNRYSEIVEILLKDKRVNIFSNNCKPIKLACERGCFKIIDLFIDEIQKTKTGLELCPMKYILYWVITGGRPSNTKKILVNLFKNNKCNIRGEIDEDILEQTIKRYSKKFFIILYDVICFNPEYYNEGKKHVLLSSCLEYASKKGFLNIVEKIVEDGNIIIHEFEPYLYKAINNCHLYIVIYFIQKTCIDPTWNDYLLLKRVCSTGRLSSSLKIMLKSNVFDFTFQNNYCLRTAVKQHEFGIVQTLLSNPKIDPYVTKETESYIDTWFPHFKSEGINTIKTPLYE